MIWMQEGQICGSVLLDDYITISELVGKGQESWIQQVVDDRSGFGKGWRIPATWKEIQRAQD